MEKNTRLTIIITMKSKNITITSFAEQLDAQYRKRGTEAREKYEEEQEAFELGVKYKKKEKTIKILTK